MGFIFLADHFEFLTYQFSTVSVLIIVGIIAFYSILPDIDHPAGTMTWVFLGIATLGIVVSIVLSILKMNFFGLLVVSALLLVCVFVSAHWLPHRGVIHSVPIGILSVIPLWYIFGSIAYCVLGYVAFHSHLLGDGYLFKTR